MTGRSRTPAGGCLGGCIVQYENRLPATTVPAPPPRREPTGAFAGVSEWHGTVFSRGDQSYGHLHAAAAAGRAELAQHLEADHGVTPSAAEFGSWCRDVEAHAAAHRVTVRPT